MRHTLCMTYTESGISPPISIAGLVRGFGDRRVLDGVDLHVDGGIHALLGSNGAGKTTLVNVVTTALRPEGGDVRVGGLDVTRHPDRIRELIGVTGQFAALDQLLTGAENLEMLGRLHGLDRRLARERARELLERFDLVGAAGRRVGRYSGGMRRRLDLAASLLVVPEVLVLDEPTTGLDIRSRQALWDIVADLADDGTAVLLTTQYLEEADHLADRISVLHRGRVVAVGSPAEIKRVVGGARLVLRADDGSVLAEHPTDGTPADVDRLLRGLPSSLMQTHISLESPSLDDAFLALTSTTEAA